MRDTVECDEAGKLRGFEAQEHLGIFVAEALSDPVPVEVRAPGPAAQELALGPLRVERVAYSKVAPTMLLAL